MAYELIHPDSEKSVEVAADQVANYVSQGWEKKPGAKAPAKSSDARTSAEK